MNIKITALLKQLSETQTENEMRIEAYMERTGYFPGVFREDRYGNVSLINTKAK